MRHSTSMLSAAAGSLLACGAANAQLIGTYNILPNNVPDVLRHVDVQGGVDGAVVTGMVASTLGPNGLPVATTFGRTRTGGSGAISDVDSVTGEIQWWSAGGTGNRTKLFDKVQVDPGTLNFPSNFFPTGQSNNSYGFRAVHWSGSFVLGPGETGSATMSVQADDDAWVFVNGQLVLDNGGVKAINLSTVSTGSSALVEGVNTLEIFFADRHQTQSGIIFQSNLNIVPAPGAAALLGLGGLVISKRRRK